MCSWDEDVITMAVEAGRDCLRGTSASSLSGLTLASTTAPYADLNDAVVVAAALRAPESASAADATGSTRAGLTSLIRACRAGAEDDSLFIASERRSASPAVRRRCSTGAAPAR